ncbi:lysophospholipid acyltransferase family protein [Spirobacillus cienkowskii]|jgi:1-acyl-sn-glycerol-3-phosphate acyltransferase|uniref:1-acyl-sn-glycerol-3-phosphate acyltransferase n=1 Tax=Spirobacillus cienkowskii TaxID=495820 RepID=A0A369KZL9_9BACT|nr:MAG: 1-acyl-sn-glycerol-3-phosphate acyltransferase [Spirobacillus cienkowskii]
MKLKIILKKMGKEFINIFRGVYTWINIIILSIFFSTTIIISFPFVFFVDKERHSLHKLAAIWALAIQYLNPWWKFSIKGKENLAKKNEAVIYVANHQSQADILALFILSTRFRWIAKASLFKIPFFGWGMKLIGYVPVERGNKLSAEKSLKLSSRHLKNGTPMIFFPEGTRSKTGSLGEFKTGAYRLAKTLNLPIVPITINGCAKMLPKGSILPKKSNVSITIHPRIEPNNLSYLEILEKSREAILSKLKT